jgi:hypothetical protein
VGLTGDVTLKDAAVVSTLEGSWVGRLQAEETALKGPANAITASAQ